LIASFMASAWAARLGNNEKGQSRGTRVLYGGSGSE
jgi:hypothetical protein